MNIRCSSNQNLTFTIDNDLIIINDRSVGVRVKRDDGVLLPQFEYFPRYYRSGEPLVDIVSESYTDTTISIPKWIYDKKIGPYFRIVTR